jgi:tetratricopeptide (TPR) repeat protein
VFQLNQEEILILFSKTFVLGLLICMSMIISTNSQGQIAANSENDTEFEQARHVFHRAYFEKASLLFEEYVKKDPDNSLALAYQAVIDLMLYKNPDATVEKVQRLIKNEKSSDLFAQALIDFVKSDYRNCEIVLMKHLKDFPDDPYAMHVLGFAQIDDERPEEGLETLLQLLDAHPDFFPAYNHTAYAYLRLKQNEEAIMYFKLFLESDSLNPSAHDSYADGLETIGEYETAIAHLARAILIEPEFAYGWKHAGEIFEKIGETEFAVLSYKKAMQAAEYYGEAFLQSMKTKIATLSN